MLKKIIFSVIIMALTVHYQTECMQPRPQPEGLQIQPNQPTYEEARVQHFQKALSLLTQQYWQAKREQQLLPQYFFNELDRYYQQVPYSMSKIRNQFSALKQEAEKIRQPQ